MTKCNENDTKISTSKGITELAGEEVNNDTLFQLRAASRKRSRILFAGDVRSEYASRRVLVPTIDRAIHKMSVARRVRLNYPLIPSADTDGTDAKGQGQSISSDVHGKTNTSSMTDSILKELKDEAELAARATIGKDTSNVTLEGHMVLHRPLNDSTSENNGGGNENNKDVNPESANTLVSPVQKQDASFKNINNNNIENLKDNSKSDGILTKSTITKVSKSIPTPKWHAPWKLSTVLSSHLGWVRSIAFDSTNDIFATGAADRTIKIFDFAKSCVGSSDALKITLTGHISPIRGLAFSPRHPYLFSAGEDKMVKCWDLETNQVVRHYHGHLSGVFCLKLHPTLDLLVTGGRDAVARVWDMRTKQQVHVLTGHDNTVGTVLTKPTDPQIVTGSYDSTIKLWDLIAGKCMSTLTHHKKAVRALVQPSFEQTFVSGAADTLKKWSGKDGQFVNNLSGHKAVVNALAVNDDGVLVSGADDGSMRFWDYGSGYQFQQMETIAQPGSLDAENGVYVAEFDLTGTRLITGEADKTIKIWKQDDNASEFSHPIDMTSWRNKCLKEAKQRF
eukprot:CAMPEP_0184868446 /NCGR_PEP_ID=MMETSP0580-20130426/30449_1 /TAXON_ID=1118495 /ORGANISM="Dactyliosolen fragilissimus" /LENGTH=562 /DNA_ID=CAMNT_0027369341 /DNA_START=66 /DNA_END=1754 /DNA_ORIENTATION=-